MAEHYRPAISAAHDISVNQRYLIVHADDFGLSEKISDGIVLAHKEGVLTSTSVIATGKAFVHAMETCRSLPTMDLGVHLTLVEERPVLNPSAIPSLVNANGFFFDHATTFIRRYATGNISLMEIRQEFEAQIKRVLDWHIPVSHLDTHQHLHGLPAIRHIVDDLAGKYRIPAVRYPREKLRWYMLRNIRMLPRTLQLLALNFFCRLGNTPVPAHTDHFAGFYFGGYLTRTNLRTLIDNLPPHGSCEMMCHPGLPDASGVYGHWNYHWADELDALLDPQLPELLRHNGIHLIGYRDLAAH
jgi:predicted glycoside hydrolase/deacetylase ChbG (UPF0249 family)